MNRSPGYSGKFILCLTILIMAAGNTAAGDRGSGGINAPEHRGKPTIVLVSIDGFRWDFPELADTPAFDRIAAGGTRAEALQPVYPTLTFPNHFSIATGVLPRHHGVVANEFPDGKRENWYHYKDRSTVQDGNWYLAEPVWVTAEKQGMVTAAYFYVGTEADIGGIRPTHWRAFNADDEDEMRVRQVLEWLSEPPETRPHLVTLYTEDVDDHSHWNGPGSAESIKAIQRVDQRLGQLLDGIENLPHRDDIYLVLVSDHGQAGYDPRRQTLVLDELIDLEGVRAVEGGPYVYLFFENPQEARLQTDRDVINTHWDCGRALLPAEAPAAWAVDDSPRYPDLIVQANPGCSVLSRLEKQHKITAGDHGWPPEMPEMKGIFYAMGPGIPAGKRLGVVHATDVYPLMLAILGLSAPHAIDGNPDLLPSLLQPVR